jgi:hypothetical protein
MRTLRDEMLRLQGALREGLVTEDDYKLAVRERGGRMLGQGGRLLPKRAWIGTEVNGERAMPASQASQRGHSRSVKLDKGKRAPEIRARDMLIKAGVYPVRVVKVQKQSEPLTAMAVALSAAVE